MQLVRLSEAQTSPVLMVDVIDHGRVLVDRGDLWPGLREGSPRWRRLARNIERSSSEVDVQNIDHHAA
jgi:hypothetical protein